MKKHLMLLLTLSALLTYRPGHAQARTEGPNEPSPTLVASTRARPVTTHATTEANLAKASGTVKKETKSTAKATQKPIGRFWSRIMGICSEVHMASKKKS